MRSWPGRTTQTKSSKLRLRLTLNLIKTKSKRRPKGYIYGGTEGIFVTPWRRGPDEGPIMDKLGTKLLFSRARARQLNYQVLSFLASPSIVHEHKMLPKVDTFICL